MEQQTRLEEATEAKARGDFIRAEQIYHEILSKSAGSNEVALREQESALIQLGQLYRDQKYLPLNPTHGSAYDANSCAPDKSTNLLHS
jgi:hypothetical protein